MEAIPAPVGHSHVFLGEWHAANKRRTWAVIRLCGAMMVAEIAGGALFGSIALVADGLHMSAHAGALLIAALAYTYARRHAVDPRFAFGTGKLGDLAGFTSAIILAMIALLIGYEAVGRLLRPVPISFGEAIPTAVLGLIVNVASAWLLSSGGHHHGHEHGHENEHADDETHRIDTGAGTLLLEAFEDGVPPRFRLRAGNGRLPDAARVETLRPDGSRQAFELTDRGGFLESVQDIPEPHAFIAEVTLGSGMQSSSFPVAFTEHDHAPHGHGPSHRDNNLRAAFVHVMADAAVSVLVITGLVLARAFGWLWMDPAVGIVGALVIANWSCGLVRDTGGILLDMTPDRRLAERVRSAVLAEGDQPADLHLWRLGPGHLRAIISIVSAGGH